MHILNRLLSLGLLITFLFLMSSGCSRPLPEKVRAKPAANSAIVQAPKSLEGKKVLIVHSWHAESRWAASINEGILPVLEKAGVEYEIFYMDTRRKTDEKWKVQAGRLASEKLESYKPDVVITVDDNAQQYFAKRYVDGDIFFVFCGVNADPSKYGYPASNVTGVIERPNFKKTIEYAREIRPIKHIAMLSSDDPTSIGAFSFMKEDDVEVEVVEWNRVTDFEDWKDAVKRCNGTVDAFGIYMYHTIKEKGNPISLEPKEVMKWTAENAAVPTLGFFDFGIEDGLLIGIVESGFEHGEKAAKYAVELMKGTPISSLPVIKANIGMKMINTDTAGRLGINLAGDVLDGALTVPGEQKWLEK